MPRRSPLIATAAAGLCVLAGCGTDEIPLAVPAPSDDVAAACSALDTELPDTVLGGSSRVTTPESPLTAAWGDPAIALTCGVPRPANRPADAQLFDVNDVTWFAQELTNGTRFTSEGRTANVQVDVPVDYRPEAEALIDLAPAITAALPSTTIEPLNDD